MDRNGSALLGFARFAKLNISRAMSKAETVSSSCRVSYVNLCPVPNLSFFAEGTVNVTLCKVSSGVVVYALNPLTFVVCPVA